jgi:hypothetical protein
MVPYDEFHVLQCQTCMSEKHKHESKDGHSIQLDGFCAKACLVYKGGQRIEQPHDITMACIYQPPHLGNQKHFSYY